MDDLVFLTFEEIEALHRRALDEFGGREGIRDEGVLRAATAAPAQTFGGEYLNEDVTAMAATYLHSFSEGQGFVDGNKRTGVSAAYVFLAMNGYDTDFSELELYDVAMRVAKKFLTKDGAAVWIREKLSQQP